MVRIALLANYAWACCESRYTWGRLCKGLSAHHHHHTIITVLNFGIALTENMSDKWPTLFNFELLRTGTTTMTDSETKEDHKMSFQKMLHSLLETWHILKVVAFWDFSPVPGWQWSGGATICGPGKLCKGLCRLSIFGIPTSPPLPTRQLGKSEYIWKMLKMCASLSRNTKNMWNYLHLGNLGFPPS